VHLAGLSLGDYRHVCAFFNSENEEYRALLPFIEEGMQHGDRAVHVMDAKRRRAHMERLRSAGLDVDDAQRKRQLDVRASEDTYLKDGRFSEDAMLALIQETLEAGRAFGFALTRLVAHAEFVFEDLAGATAFVEYEARLNYILPRNGDVVVCTYDLARVNAGAAMDVLRTHPVVLIGATCQENPFFVPPDAFLEELRGRRPGGAIERIM
jgi:hypothetical protein